jgi:hypothetical protein
MKAIKALFAIAAVYDGVLGLLFFVAPANLFERFNVQPPNHFGYIQFPALLLLMFGVLFAQIARDPIRHRQLIPYGIWLKLAYCSLAFWYWAQTDIPWIWKPFAIADLVMLVLFVWSYQWLGKTAAVDRGVGS